MTNYWENKFNSEEKYQRIVNKMSSAMKDGRLVFFIGAGISRIQGYPSWNEYIDKLLVYWESHINGSDINPNSMENIITIEEIAKSNYSNKRKVDLLYQLLEETFESEVVDSKKVEFERYYFTELTPISNPNPVLNELARLEAIYLTTNYDNQIEKHLKEMKTISAPVKDITELTETVVDKVRNWIKNKKLLLVFIGSSMEEDEVLSLLTDEEETNSIAFLATENTEHPGKRKIRNLLENYHLNKNRTEVFWYGSEFSDLPLFIQKLVVDVQNAAYPRSENAKMDDWYAFRNVDAQEHKVVSVINNSSIMELDAYLEDLDPELSMRRSHQIINSEIFAKVDQELPVRLWSILLLNSDSFDSEEKDKIVQYVLGQNMSYRYSNVYELIKKFSLDKATQKLFEKKMGEKNEIRYTSFVNNPNILGWHLVFEIAKGDRHTSFFDTRDFKYNLVPEAIEELKIFFENDQNDLKFIRMESPEMIIEKNNFNALYQALRKNSITFDNLDWKDRIPDKLISDPIFIKMFMLLYKDKLLPEEIITKIIKFGDFSNINYGKLFNDFYDDHVKAITERHEGIERVSYVDGIFSLPLEIVRESTLISEQQLLTLDEESIVQILTKKDKKSDSDFFQKISATIDFFKEILKQSNTQIAEIADKILKTNVSQLYPYYKELYIWHQFDKDNHFKLNDDLIKQFIAYYDYTRFSSFDFVDADLLENLLELEEYVEQISSLLLDVDFSIFSNEEQLFDDDFTYVDFFQSSMGRFLNLFASISSETNESLNQQIINLINRIPFENVKNYMYGRHYELFAADKYTNYLAFKGFSSRYTAGLEMTVKFKEVVTEILKNGITDTWIERNTGVVALQQIDPFTLVSFNWEQINTTKIFDLIFHYSYDFKFQTQWIDALFQNQSDKYFEKLILLFHSKAATVQNKLLRLVLSPQNLISASNVHLNLGYMSADLGEISPNLQKLYIELLSQVIKSKRISIKTLDVEVIEMILGNIQKSERGNIFEVLHQELNEGLYNRLLTKYPRI